MPRRGSARPNCRANWGRAIRRCARPNSRSQDLRRTISEEVERFAQSAKNDLTRARDYEASLGKALETQKRQSVQMSQASVRLRELERDVEASRDVYQSFLKRSRETEEQETLNTSSARIIGDATVPQRRTFPPGMSLIAMIGFVLGGLAAAAWIVAVNQLTPGANPVQPRRSVGATGHRAKNATTTAAELPPPAAQASAATRHRPDREAADRAAAGIRRDAHARRNPDDGQHRRRHAAGLADAARRLSADDVPQRHARDARRADQAQLRDTAPVMAVIGAGPGQDRSIAALNIALAAARDGARVLMIDADHKAHALSDKVGHLGMREPSRLGWLSIGTKTARAIKTANGISILPAAKASRTQRPATPSARRSRRRAPPAAMIS